MQEEQKYMKLALKEATKAYKKNEVPVGAVITLNNKIISKAHNTRHKTKNPLNHAEVIAITKACKKLGDWRLSECVMYVTLYPCEMCLGLIKEVRIKKVIYGASLNKEKNDNKKISLIKTENNEECVNILNNFFKNRRKNI